MSKVTAYKIWRWACPVCNTECQVYFDEGKPWITPCYDCGAQFEIEIPVQSCANCLHWTGELNAEGRATCRRLEELSRNDHDEDFETALIVAWPECGHDGPAVTFETKPEFGCVLWAEKTCD